MIADLWSHRELIFTLVKRDLKVRYKASALGFLWSFGRPLFLMIILWAVFSHIVKINTHIPYTLHLLTGLLPWMYLQGALSEGQFSILGSSNVVKKVYLPTEAFPSASVISNLVHLILALIVLFGFILIYVVIQSPTLLPGWEIILLPALIVLQTMLLLGLALILSSLMVFYRDVGSISEIVLTAWFYLTPVIYPVQYAREELKGMFGTDLIYYIYLCNPMTPIIVGYRRVLYGRELRYAPEISDATLLASLSLSAITSLVLMWYGAKLFHRLSKKFADEL